MFKIVKYPRFAKSIALCISHFDHLHQFASCMTRCNWLAVHAAKEGTLRCFHSSMGNEKVLSSSKVYTKNLLRSCIRPGRQIIHPNPHSSLRM